MEFYCVRDDYDTTTKNCILGNILKAQPLQYNKLVKVKFDNFYVEM